MTAVAPHPLAHALVERLATRGIAPERAGRLLVVGVGRGRSLPPLLAAGYDVDAIDERPELIAACRARFERERALRLGVAGPNDPSALGRRYVGMLATSAYLHGTLAKLTVEVARLYAALAPEAIVALTLGSTNDPRYGTGQRIDDETWAPLEGPELGVPHVFLDADGARDLFARFAILALTEHDVADVAGSWAHEGDPLPPQRHWFLEARRPA